MKWDDKPSQPDESRYKSVAEILHKHATERGAKEFITAMDQAGRSITYGQLWRLSNRLSRFLAARNINAGERIAVLAKNSLEMAVLYFSIQR